ncbi:hypothetical protein AAVH_31881, partial [Aphelenchoides avenae]
SVLDFTRQRHAVLYEERERVRQRLAEIEQEHAELIVRERQLNDELIALSQRHISYLEAKLELVMHEEVARPSSAPNGLSHGPTAAAGAAEASLYGPGVSTTSTFGRESVSVTPVSELYRPSTSMYNGAAAKYVHPSTSRMTSLLGNADTRKRKADQAVPYDPSPASGPMARMPTAGSNKIDYATFERHMREVKKFLSDRAFSCQVCKKVFAGNTPENAMKHLLRHLDDHSLYPYKCAHDVCDYTAITEDEVKYHVTSEHQVVWTEDVKRQCTHAENKARLDALCEKVNATPDPARTT